MTVGPATIWRKSGCLRGKQGQSALLHAAFGNDKSLPTVTVYNHMDVQPASKETEPWDTEPFVMTRKGDSYLDAAQLTTRDPLSLRFTAPAPHSKLVSP